MERAADLNRRRLIKGFGLLGASVGLQTPAVAKRIARSAPFRIITPENSFGACDAFSNSFKYTHEQLKNNIVIGRGDSNMWGGKDKEPKPTSYLGYLGEAAQRKWDVNWRIINHGTPGWDTKYVTAQFEDSKDRQWFNQWKSLDLWLNVGGNDFMSVVNTIDKAQAAEQLLQNPIDIKTLSYATAIVNAIESFGENFGKLMDTVLKLHSSRIQHLVVVSAPNFGKLQRLDSGDIEGETFRFQLEQSMYKRLFSKVCSGVAIHMNDQMAGVMERCAEEYPKVRIMAIDTYNFDFNPFEDDEHFNKQAKLEIPQMAIKRCELITA